MKNENRLKGYYWCYNNKVYRDTDNWRIYFWDGSMFWEDGDDFDESCFEFIDEKQIVRDSQNS
jgi:hypothetical protein